MLKIDAELKALIPALSTEEYAQLEKNVLVEGIREPLIVWYQKPTKEDFRNVVIWWFDKVNKNR